MRINFPEWWNNLSLRGKLRFSLLPVLLVAVVVILIAAQSAIITAITNSARSVQQQRVETAQTAMNTVLENTAIVLDSIRANEILADGIQQFARLRAGGNSIDTELQRTRINFALLDALQRNADIVVEGRVLDANGVLITRLTLDPERRVFQVSPQQEFTNESQAPYIRQLAQANAGTLYLTRVLGPNPSDLSNQLNLEYGTPFKQGDSIDAYLLFTVNIVRLLDVVIGPEGNVGSALTTLIDESGAVIAANHKGSRYFYSDQPFKPLFALPSQANASQPFTFVPTSQTPNQFASMRLLPVRSSSGLHDWHLVLSELETDILGPGEAIRFAVFLPILIAFAFVGILTSLIARIISRPMVAVSTAAQRIASGDFQFRLPIQGKDEIALVSASLNKMAQQTTVLVDTLEQRVAARTREIEAVAQLSRDLSSIRDLDELLQRTVNALAERFNFYHVQVFLVDEKSEYAVLRSSTGEAGRQLLARNHRLTVGSASIIGQVTQFGRPFITLDTRSSEVPHKFNPLLPATRSEMALPIRFGGRTAGALDVQSEQPDAFDKNTIRIFQILADQLATTIENARLLIAAQQSGEQVAALNSQLTREAWEAYAQTRPELLGYSYNNLELKSLLPGAPASGVEAPLSIRGEQIGTLNADAERPLTDEDRLVLNAVAERVALTIDNLRQVERTQEEARRNRALAEAAQIVSQFGGNFAESAGRLLTVGAQTEAYDRWWLGQVAPDGKVLSRLVAFATNTGLLPIRVEIASDPTSIGMVARDGTPVLIDAPDAAQPPAFGRHLAMPIRYGAAGTLFGVLLVGRAFNTGPINESDWQLVGTLVNQLSVAAENRRLITELQAGREALQSILNSLPTGVLVLDAITRNVSLANAEASAVLDLKSMSGTLPDILNPASPDFAAAQALALNRPVSGTDVTIDLANGSSRTYLVSAAPIFGADGVAFSAVATFTDTSTLRDLEVALQANLIETQVLYQTTRLISAQREITDILDVSFTQVLDRVPANHAFVYFQTMTDTRASIYYAGAPENVVRVWEGALPFQPQAFERDIDATLDNPIPEPGAPLRLATIVTFPLQVRNETTGWIVLGFDRQHTLQQDDRRFMSSVVDQIAVAAESARLSQETIEALGETEVLYQASRAIADAPDADAILSVIIREAAPPQIDRAFLVGLIGTEWGAPDSFADIIAEWSSAGDIRMRGRRVPVVQFDALFNIQSQAQVVINDVAKAAELPEIARTTLLQIGMGALVSIPLISRGRTVGSFALGASQPHDFTARELRLYRLLADQAAIALENRTLLRQTEERARQLATSAQVSQAATSTLKLNDLLDMSVDLIRDSFGYDHVQIFLISPDGRNAELRASTGDAGRQLLAVRHSLGVGSNSVIGRVTSGGALYNVADVGDPSSVHRPNKYLPKTRAELALPLVARGQIVGALDVQSNTPAAFSAEAETLLTSLADQLAVAIDNARLFEVSNRRLEEVRFLFNVTRTAAAVEIDVALTRVTREILSATTSDLAVLLLMDEDKNRLLTSYAAKEGATYILPTSLSAETPTLANLFQARDPLLLQAGSSGLLFSSEDVPGLEAMLLVPFYSGVEPLGVIAVASERKAVYTDDTATLLQTLSSTLSAIIQNARLLAEMQEANRRLREVDGLKSQFLANMSHELRTPLNSIIGFSRVILKGIDGPLNEAQEQDLGTIHESGKHLLNLVNDILDQAKIEAGKMELALDYFRLEDMIKTAMATASGLVKDRPIRLHQEIQANLPLVYGDEFRTRQVLLNVLSNAAKFTKQGSITLSAFTVQVDGRPMAQISVTDTGIGISKENLRRVFAQFEQVDNTTSRGAEGTGLGMPIAKSLIEMQGGQIWLESEIGIGSTFSVTIPTGPTHDPTAISEPESTPADPLPTELQEQVVQALDQTPRPLQRIIIAIDDEPGMLSMYRRFLAKDGFEIIGTTNPEEAVELIATYQPSAVLLDVNMPQRDGWETLRAIKDDDQTFQYPVIVCSIEDDKARGFRLGASEYLVKPFVAEDLVAAIRHVELGRDLPTVLIVNPDGEALAHTREGLAAQVDTLRFREASSIELAHDMIDSHRPELVLFDLRTGKLDVMAALAALRGRAVQPRVIILPGPSLSNDDLIALASSGVTLETGLTDAMLPDLVRFHLGLNRSSAD